MINVVELRKLKALFEETQLIPRP